MSMNSYAVWPLTPPSLSTVKAVRQFIRSCERWIVKRLFGNTQPGWPRVQAICDFVNAKIRFGYPHASATRTAADALSDQRGVCRDFAHLAITLCRCMNIPARYCTGYLGDIGSQRRHF